MRKELGNTGKRSVEELRHLSKDNGGGAEWGIHLVDAGHLPALPPLTDKFRVAEITRSRDLISRTQPKRKTCSFYFEEIEVEVSTTTGDVALIGAIAEDRYHLDPESLLPISEGHQAVDIFDVKSMPVSELALQNDLTGDKIENVAHFLLGEERRTVQWAPRTAYRKDLQTSEASKSFAEDAVLPTYDELTPDEKRNHLIDAIGAVTSIASEDTTLGANHKEITDALSLIVGKLDTEWEAIDSERLLLGAERASETTWDYVDAAIQEEKRATNSVPSSDLWEERGIARPKGTNLDVAESLIPNAKNIFLAKKARLLDAKDTTKLRF